MYMLSKEQQEDIKENFNKYGVEAKLFILLRVLFVLGWALLKAVRVNHPILANKDLENMVDAASKRPSEYD
jgi:predicted negative regulator of RcsB-dependent stress response